MEAERRLKDYIFKSDLVIKSGGIVQWDYDIATGIFSSPNPESFMYHGITTEEYYSYMYGDDIHIVEEALQELIQGEVETITIQVRVKLQNKDYRWVEIHGVAYERDDKGKLVKVTGLRRDITDWKSVTNELILLRDKAEEPIRLKTAFLANIEPRDSYSVECDCRFFRPDYPNDRCGLRFRIIVGLLRPITSYYCNCLTIFWICRK